MKIKIIDLLKRIANGEEVPEKIKFNDVIWEYKKKTEDYYSTITNEPFFNDYSSLGFWVMKHLNHEVEIIEEDKPIEELKTEIVDTERKLKGIRGTKYSIRVVDNILINKINELVKEINKLKKTINKITGTDKVIEEIKKKFTN